MNTTFEALAECLLTKLQEGTLSDALIYEFTEKCYESIQEEAEIPWTGAVDNLWDYVSISRTASLRDGQDIKTLFQQGQIFTAMEFIKIMQEKREDESIFEEDARHYDEHWYRVFAALKNGNSLTHGELAAVCRLSESSLSQFMHKIEQKRYILSRKIGRTKYYRLSSRGQKLLSRMTRNRAASVRGIVQPIYPFNAYSVLMKSLYSELTESSSYSDIIDENYNNFLLVCADDAIVERLNHVNNQYATV